MPSPPPLPRPTLLLLLMLLLLLLSAARCCTMDRANMEPVRGGPRCLPAAPAPPPPPLLLLPEGLIMPPLRATEGPLLGSPPSLLPAARDWDWCCCCWWRWCWWVSALAVASQSGGGGSRTSTSVGRTNNPVRGCLAVKYVTLSTHPSWPLGWGAVNSRPTYIPGLKCTTPRWRIRPSVPVLLKRTKEPSNKELPSASEFNWRSSSIAKYIGVGSNCFEMRCPSGWVEEGTPWPRPRQDNVECRSRCR